MTIRDEVWDEVLLTLVHKGKFKISDLKFEDEQRHTIRRVLKKMEEDGWVTRESKQAAYWRLGPKAEMLLDVDAEIISASKQ